MNLRSVNRCPARLFWAMRVFKRDTQVVLGDGCEFFGQFACRPTGSINFRGAGIIDDLPGRQVAGCNQGKMLCQGRRNGEVARCNDSELAGLRSLCNVRVKRDVTVYAISFI